MDAVERLEAIEEIGTLKARYCRLVDTQQWSAFRSLFAEDAQFDAEEVMGEIPDLDAFIAGAKHGLAYCVSIHHCHCPEIEVLSPTSATGIWAMEDRLRWHDQHGKVARLVHGFGHYRETYCKVGGAWKIAHWKLSRLHVETSCFE